jgi:glutamine synthetase
MSVTEIMTQYKELLSLQQEFKMRYDDLLVVGAELEFYLLQDICPQQISELIGYELKPEKGLGQYEINFTPSTDLDGFAAEINRVKCLLEQQAHTLGGKVMFDAKPFADDYGSSLHIHINSQRQIHDVQDYARILCAHLPSYLHACFDSNDDLKRLDRHFMAPEHICWGGNNRSVMIRIPDARPLRIEHRLPGANIDPRKALRGILSSLLDGLSRYEGQYCQLPFAKIHGNAFDEQYNLPKIVPLCGSGMTDEQ